MHNGSDKWYSASNVDACFMFMNGCMCPFYQYLFMQTYYAHIARNREYNKIKLSYISLFRFYAKINILIAVVLLYISPTLRPVNCLKKAITQFMHITIMAKFRYLFFCKAFLWENFTLLSTVVHSKPSFIKWYYSVYLAQFLDFNV